MSQMPTIQVIAQRKELFFFYFTNGDEINGM